MADSTQAAHHLASDTPSMTGVDAMPDPRSVGWAAPAPGHVLVWREETNGYWHVPTRPRWCRWKPKGALTPCGASAVVQIARGAFTMPDMRRRPQQWRAYCADHSHCRVVVDGRVWGVRMVRIEEANLGAA